MGWKAGRCRLVKFSELLSMEKCDQAVMDFLAANVAEVNDDMEAANHFASIHVLAGRMQPNWSKR
jgi:hypothetical protein